MPNSLTAQEILELFEHETCCAYCLRPFKTVGILGDGTIDHVTPLYRGGGNTRENVVLACVICNGRKNRHGVLCMVNQAEQVFQRRLARQLFRERSARYINDLAEQHAAEGCDEMCYVGPDGRLVHSC